MAESERTRPYSIKITDVTAGRDVVLMVVNLADDELRSVVDQVLRLAGAPADNFAEMVAPRPKSRRKH